MTILRHLKKIRGDDLDPISFFQSPFHISKGENNDLEDKIHISPTVWPPKNSQIDDAQGKFSKKFQTALATVQIVRLTHGIRQNLLETCTFLMVPC